MNLETTREVQGRVQQAPSHLYDDAYSRNAEVKPRTEQRSTTQLPESLLPGAQIGSCGSINLDCSPAARNWRPAAPDSAQGRAWEQRAERQRNAPLERDEAGRYVIKDGDSLGRIAERMLREQKPGASRRDVQEGIQRILEANPALKCNPDLIRRGQVIVIPGRGGDAAVPQQGERTAPADTARPAAPRPIEPSNPSGQRDLPRTTDTARPDAARPLEPIKPYAPARLEPAATERPATGGDSDYNSTYEGKRPGQEIRKGKSEDKGAQSSDVSPRKISRW